MMENNLIYKMAIVLSVIICVILYSNFLFDYLIRSSIRKSEIGLNRNSQDISLERKLLSLSQETLLNDAFSGRWKTFCWGRSIDPDIPTFINNRLSITRNNNIYVLSDSIWSIIADDGHKADIFFIAEIEHPEFIGLHSSCSPSERTYVTITHVNPASSRPLMLIRIKPE